MSKKFGFLSNLEEGASSQKVKYQLFEAEIGFEKMSILIPFDNADEFETAVQIKPPKTKSAMLKLAEKFRGTLE